MESTPKFYTRFLKDFKWKFIAVFIGLLSWVIAVNIDDPLISVAFIDSIQVDNSEFLALNELIILNETALRERISGVYQVRMSDEMYIEKVAPVVDLSKLDVDLIKSSEGYVEIDLPIGFKIETTLSDNRYFVELNKELVSLRVDALQRTRFPVEVQIRTDVDEGFSATPVRLSNNSIFLVGPRSLMGSVDKVVVYLDLETVEYDINLNVPPVVLDKDGVDITRNFTVSHSQVRVDVSVDRTVKVPVHAPAVSGAVAEECVLKGVKFYPQFIEVVGNANDLTTFDRFMLPSVNIDGLTHNKVIPIKVDELLPENIVRAANTPENINITVEVEAFPEEVFFINTSQLEVIELEGDISLPEQISIKLKGPGELFDSFIPEKLKGTIDVSGLESGEYTVPVNFDLPNGLRLVNPVTMKVEIVSIDIPEDELEGGFGDETEVGSEEGKAVSGIEDDEVESGDLELEEDEVESVDLESEEDKIVSGGLETEEDGQDYEEDEIENLEFEEDGSESENLESESGNSEVEDTSEEDGQAIENSGHDFEEMGEDELDVDVKPVQGVST